MVDLRCVLKYSRPAVAGSSALAIASSLVLSMPTLAQQAQPGDARCPIVNGIATCSGNLQGGIRYFAPNPPITELRIENVTAPIAPDGIFAIGLDRPNTDFRLIIADGVIINTFENAAIVNPSQGIITIPSSGRDTFVDTGANITVDGRGLDAVGIEGAISGAGADYTLINRGSVTVASNTRTVNGVVVGADTATGAIMLTNTGVIRTTTTTGNAGGIFIGASASSGITATNSGAITTSTTGQATSAIAVQAGASPGEVRVNNSAALSATSGGTGERDTVTAGILSGRASGLTSIVNRGDITVTTGPATQDTNFVGAAAAIVANNNAGGSILVDNNANLTGSGQDTGGMTLFVNNGMAAAPGIITVTNAGTISTNGSDVFGIIAQARGTSAELTLTSSAAITQANANNTTGLFILNESAGGRMTLTNTGTINATGPRARGLGISTFNAPVTGTYTALLTNSGAITLNATRADGLTNFWTADDTVAFEIRNTGNLDLSATTSAFSNGILAGEGLAPAGVTTRGTSAIVINNQGNIAMGAGQAIFARATNLTVNNSGTLTTTANPDTDGNAANVIDIEGLTRGTTGGTVSFTTTGNITASGSAADGLRLTNSGASTVAIQSGATVTSGTGASAAAVRLAGAGGASTVTIAGTIQSAGGTALSAASGSSLTLANSGTITGATAIDSAITSNLTNAATGRIVGGVTTGAQNDVFEGQAGSLMTGSLNTGAGTDTVALAAGAVAGSIGLGDGSDTLILNGQNAAISAIDGGAGDDLVRFGGATSYAFDFSAQPVTGIERFSKVDAATLTLTGTAPTTGIFSVSGGTLIANGTTTSLGFDAAAGGTLAGTGSLGTTTASGGTISPGGDAAGTLSAASLVLSANSTLLYDLGAAGVVGGATNDLITVTGALTLDGSLDIDAAPTFGQGVYRLINYGGALTDNGLIVRTAPSGTFSIQTAVAGQVNLVSSSNGTQFWDGGGAPNDNVIAGGSGVWNAANSNWTNMAGNANAPWAGNFGVFQGAAGTVTVEGAQNVTGLQFVTTGYTLAAGTAGQINLNVAETPIRTDAGVTATISAALGGTGALVKRDTGTLILGAANTYTGGTQMREGVLQISADAGLGAAAGSVTLDGGTLRAGGAVTSARGFTIGAAGGTLDTQGNALALSGVVGGAGALVKAGTGTLTLSGNSAARTGATSVAAGVLDLTGSLGGAVTIAPGATLTGNGTAGSLIVNGIVAPTGTGTLTVANTIAFNAGSTYRVDLAASGAGDRINAGGTATLNGGTVAITALDPELNYTDDRVYRILNATGGRTGTFTGLTESSAFLDFTLGYDPTGAFVTVDVIRMFPAVATTFNQAQSASGLSNFDRTAGSDSLAVFNAILFLDAGPARAAFDSASGEIHASVAASSLRQASSISDRLISRTNVKVQPGLSLWASGQISDGSIDRDGNAARVSFDAKGGLIGIDYRSTDENFVAGIALGYGENDTDVVGRGSRAKSDGFHFAGYGRVGTGGTGFSVSGVAGYGSSDADTTRRVNFGTISRTATASYDVEILFGALEARYGFGAADDGWAYGPLGSIAYYDVSGDRFGENGAGSLNLTGQGVDGDLVRYGGGGFARFADAKSWLEASAQYVTSKDNTQSSRQFFAGAPGTSFTVLSPSGREQGGLFSLAGEVGLGGGISVGGSGSYFVGNNGNSINGSATIRLAF